MKIIIGQAPIYSNDCIKQSVWVNNFVRYRTNNADCWPKNADAESIDWARNDCHKETKGVQNRWQNDGHVW